MLRKSNVIFTNRKHSPKSIMSSSLGLISVVSMGVCTYLSYMDAGAENARYAAACILAMIFAFVGIVLGIMGRMEKDGFYLFAYIGVFLNVLALAMVSVVLYAGALL